MRNLVFVVLLICSACASPTVIVKQNTTIEKLGIYFESGQYATPLLSIRFDRELDAFIETYNAQPNHRIHLFRASKSDSSSLHIKLVATRLVSPGQQSAGVVCTLVGLSMPIALAAA